MAGRPKKLLTDAQIKQLPKLSEHGLNLEQIADLFEISDNTLRKRIREDPAILAVYKKAKAAAANKVTGKLWTLINKNDRAAIFFYLKTQLGWRETQGVDVTSGDEPIKFTLNFENNHDNSDG